MAEPEGQCKHCMIWFIRFIKVFTVIALLATIAAYVVIIDYGVKTDAYNNIDKAFCVLGNTGFILMCVFLVIAEFEPIWFVKRVAIMHYWAARGFWIIWMGILTIATAKQLGATIESDKDSEVDGDFVKVFGTVIGSVMIGCGVIFCLLSLFCVRSLTQPPDELSSPLSDMGNATEEAILAANMAIALGMTPSDAKKRFSRDKGVKEAQAFAKQRADQLAMLEKASKDAKNMAGASAKYATDAASSYAAAAAAPPPQQSSKYQPNDAYSDPSSGGGGTDGKKDDEDELMRAYYGR